MRSNERGPERRRRRWPRIVFWVVVALSAAVIVLSVWQPSLIHVDPEPRGPVITNLTAQTIYVYYADPDGSEFFGFHVPAGESREAFGACEGELVARDRAGTLIARRGPFERCNLDPWVIEPPDR